MYYDVEKEVREVLKTLDITVDEYADMMQYLSLEELQNMDRCKDIGERVKYLIQAYNKPREVMPVDKEIHIEIRG